MVVGNNVSSDLQETVRDVVGRNFPISTFCSVTHETKADKLESRILALSNFRLYILMSAKGGQLKLEQNIPYLDLQSIESKLPHKLVLGTAIKKLVFFVHEDNAAFIDTIVFPIVEFFARVFPKVPLGDMLHRVDIKHEKAPKRKEAILERVAPLREKDVGPCDGFASAYKCACDYHSLPYMDEVAWDIDTIYLAHATKELSLSDFDHLDSKYLIPIITALQYNSWFTALNVSKVKLSADAIQEIIKVMKTNTTIEELVLSGIGLRSEHIQVLCLSLLANNSCPLTRLDLSNNPIQDSGLNHLCGPLTKLSRGLVHLDLSSTGLTARGINRLSETFCSSKLIPTTLRTLKLANNTVKGDDLVLLGRKTLYQFLAMPNVISTLSLAGMECQLEPLFAALMRGCCNHLQELDISKNIYHSKKSNTKEGVVPMAWQEFFRSALVLNSLNMSETRLPTEALKYVLLGIASNVQVQEVKLDLGSCNLGQPGAQVLEAILPGIRNITSLNLANNGLEQSLASLLGKISQNRSIRHLAIGHNLSSKNAKHVTSAMEAAVGMIHQDDSCLESLSLADSKLRSELMILLNALGSNITLTELDISGNMMGDQGARMLSKALQINTRLRVINWDKNNTSPLGFQDIAAALKKNFTMREMPAPVHDATQAIKMNQSLTEESLKMIESMLQRNHSPHKFGGEQSFRLHQGFLNSTAHQLLDEPSLKLQESLSELEKNEQAQQILVYDLEMANKVLLDVNKSRQLMLRLQKAAVNVDDSDGPIALKLAVIADDLNHTIEDTLKITVENMVSCAEKQCPTILEDQALRSEINEETREKCVLPASFTQALVQQQLALDIANKVNALNLSAASDISDRILDGAIEAMSKMDQKLQGHLNTLRSGMPLDALQADYRKSLIRGPSIDAPPPDKKEGEKLSVTRKTRIMSRMRPKTMELLDDAPSLSIASETQHQPELLPRAPARRSIQKQVPPPPPSTLPPNYNPDTGKYSPVPKPRTKRDSKLKLDSTPPKIDAKNSEKEDMSGNVSQTVKEDHMLLAGFTQTSSRTDDTSSADNSPPQSKEVSDDEGVAMERDDASATEMVAEPMTLQPVDNVDKSMDSLIDSMECSTPDSLPPSREGTPEQDTPDGVCISKPIATPPLPLETPPAAPDHQGNCIKEDKADDKEAEPEPEKCQDDTDNKQTKNDDKQNDDMMQETKPPVKMTSQVSLDEGKSKEKTPEHKAVADTKAVPEKVKHVEKSSKVKSSKDVKGSSLKDLPTLNTDAPRLEHLAKARPKRVKTRAATRPMGQFASSPTTPNTPEEPDGDVDEFFGVSSVSTEVVPAAVKPQTNPTKEKKTSAVTNSTPEQTKGLGGFGKSLKGMFSKSPKKDPKPTKQEKVIPESPEKAELKDEPAPTESQTEDEPQEKPKPRRPMMPGAMPVLGGASLMAELRQKRESGIPNKSAAPSPTKHEEEKKKPSLKPNKPSTTKASPKASVEKAPAPKPPVLSRPVTGEQPNSTELLEKPQMRGKPALTPPMVAPKPRGSGGPKPPIPSSKPTAGGMPPATPPKPEDESSPPASRATGGDQAEGPQTKASVLARIAKIDNNGNEDNSSTSRSMTLPKPSPQKAEAPVQRSTSADHSKSPADKKSQSNGKPFADKEEFTDEIVL